MILLTLVAAAALTQWSRETPEIYTGPGYFCGGGYSVHLSPHDRVVVQAQAGGAAGAQLNLGGREVSIWTGATGGPGQVVARLPGSIIMQGNDGPRILYTVGDETPYGLHVSSSAFRGFKQDRWFFSRANFSSNAEHMVPCLAAGIER